MAFTSLFGWSLVLCSGGLVQAATSDQWRTRSIYQVLTDRFALPNGSISTPCDTGSQLYCGGSWKGIESQLDYIQGMGFDAIWISPVTAQLQGDTPDGTSYHGYWKQDLYGVNSNFGTTQDLRDLAAALHARDMYLMVDVVTNHFAIHADPSNISYADFSPFNGQQYFHSYCPINYEDVQNQTNIEQCWEGSTNVPLPDLRTEDAETQAYFDSWIAQLVANYSIDGLRIDSTLEVTTGFWSSFLEAAGVYAVGEVDNGDASLVCGFQNYMPGVMNYGTYGQLIQAFQSTSGSMTDLVDVVKVVQSDCRDPTLLGTFSENHDNPRFASLTGDMALAKNVIAFTMLSDGIPIIYQGQEQHYSGEGGGSVPFNREALWLSEYNTTSELYTFVGALNAMRKNAIADDASYATSQSTVSYHDTTTIALIKGKALTVLSNKGAQGAAYNQTLPCGNPAGTQMTELFTCTTVTADDSSNVVVPMASGVPRIYYPSAGIGESGLCGANSKTKLRRGDLPG